VLEENAGMKQRKIIGGIACLTVSILTLAFWSGSMQLPVAVCLSLLGATLIVLGSKGD
jgi:hypothetical protein